MTNEYDNPWAGLSSYQDPDDCAEPLKFCGRNNESYDVTQLIEDNILVTLYGKSGTGKTSLLNAGVFPRLRHHHYLPISIRLAMEANGISFQTCIISTITKILAKKNYYSTLYDVTPIPKDEQDQEYLWSYFARNHFYNQERKPIFLVIVFDQFEEIFKNRKSEAEVLLRQINYMMDESHALSERTINGERYIYDYNYRFILSIREDDLYRLEDSIDNNYLNAMKYCRYRLRSLSDDGAREAILLPGEKLFDEQEKDKIADEIINTARNSEDETISTNVLSLICSRLYIESRKLKTQQITSEVVKNYIADNPFEKYYYEATAGYSNKERAFIEKHLIDSSGRRDSISEAEYFKHIKNGEALLEGPQKILQRISVSSDSKDNRIELIHDSFCAPLAELKQKRLLRKRLRLFLISMCVTALSIGIAAFIFYQKHQMEMLNLSMLENNSRFVSEKASLLTDEGDSYTARLLSLAVLPPNRPYVIEAEAALRRACYHGSAIMRGHKESLCFVSFSTDGNKVISMSVDSTTIVWDANNGRKIMSKGPTPAPKDNTNALSNDDRLRAKVSVDHTDIEISDSKSGRIIRTLKGHKGKVNAIKFSPDGVLLASASDDNTIKLWDIESGREKRTLVGHTNYVTCLSFSPDGNRLVSGSEDNTVRLWDVHGNNAERLKLDCKEAMMNPSFSPDGKYIASALFIDGDITVWDATTGKRVHSFMGERYIKNISFHPTDKQILATSADSTIKIWNMTDGSLLHKLSGHHRNIRCISFSHDGKYMASASSDKTIIIWDAQSYKYLRTLSEHIKDINHVSFSNDGNNIASASDDKTIKVWDVNTGKCLKTLTGHNDDIKYVSYSPNDKLLVSASDGNTIKIWDIEAQQSIRSLKSHNGKMMYVSFLSDDIMVSASQEDGLIRVWDVATSTILCDLNGYDNMLMAVSISPEQNQIYSIFYDGVSERWNYSSLEELINETEERFRNTNLTPEHKKEYYIE